jgi:Clp amino terminal domain, pathogenicity island component/Antitoxin FitA-like, ribbon-helix-helix
MATLHVRNVPDELYELLRNQADLNGRSIGAETVVMLEHELSVSERPGRGFRVRRRRGGKTPFQHFSSRAREVVVAAQEEAHELGHGALGTEHLLLGLLRQPTTAAARALVLGGLDYAGARAAVEAAAPAGEATQEGMVPFTPGAKKALELALRESIRLCHPAIAPEHVLLGVVREADGLGARIVAGSGVDARSLRDRVLSLPAPPGVAGVRVQPPEPQPPIRVVELTGEHQSWENQLNSLAQWGYELVQIVERRAILQLPSDAESIAPRRLRT